MVKSAEERQNKRKARCTLSISVFMGTSWRDDAGSRGDWFLATWTGSWTGVLLGNTSFLKCYRLIRTYWVPML